MATWPGKEEKGPVQNDDGTYSYTIHTQMPPPCGKNLRGTGRDRDLRTAFKKANNALIATVRGHLAKCRKCDPGID